MNKKLLHDKVFILVSALVVSLLGYHFVSNAVDFSLLSIDKITNSTDSFPQSGNGESIYGSFSDDNNYIVFKSSSTNLVSGDTNGVDDIFVKNLNTSVIERVSVSSAGVEGNNTSSESGISSDGRYVAFSSSSSNLVAGDTNASYDIFVHDRNTNITERVSVATGGAEANTDSYGPSISANGRYVYFYSSATNLVAGDTNGFTDVFVHDRDLDTTERLSVSTAGAESDGNSYVFRSVSSSDGRYVVFYSAGTTLVAGDTNGDIDIFIRDTQLDTTERVSVSSSEVEANNESSTPYITPDGRYVVFSSSATNLVVGDTNAVYDAFVRDLQDGTTERVSISTGAVEGNGASSGINMSSDGRYVLFYSTGTNLVVGDTNTSGDLFIRDRQSNTTERVSLTSSGGQPNSDSPIANLSQDGRYIIFNNNGSNLISYDTNGANDLFIRDTLLDTTEWAIEFEDSNSTGLNGHSYSPSITEDNKYVVFDSEASNIVSNDVNAYRDVFVFNRMTREYEIISVATDGTQGNNTSSGGRISYDGRYVAFISSATNLVPGDTNGFSDIFLRDLTNDTTTRISVSNSNAEADSESRNVTISSDGKYVVFYSEASNLVDNDTNLSADIFLFDIDLSLISRVNVSSNGVEGDDGADNPSISGDGRFVTFESDATNLVDNDTNGVRDIFMHDTHIGDTVRVSQNTIIPHGNGGTTEPKFSGDDNFVAFASDATDLVEDDTNGSSDIFVINRLSGSIERVSVATGGIEANGHSYYPSVSLDGRYITFVSYATNLVVGDTNATEDIFIHDRQTNITERVSVTDDESEANDESSGFAPISSDGRYVVFYSNATNLVAGDTNTSGDIFLRDLQLDTTIRVSVTDGELEGNGSSLYPNISADGEIIAFVSNATNLVVGDTNAQPDVFIRDINSSTTQRVSVSSEEVEGDLEVTSEAPVISSDGRYVVFASYSTNLTVNDTNLAQDVFIRDVELGTTEILSISSNEIQGNDQSYKPSVSSNGRYVTFYSEATNLISGDTNDAGDIFIRDRELDTTERVSLRNNGTEIDVSSDRPDVSSDGRYVIFDSIDEFIKDEDFNNANDIFIRDRELNTTDFIVNFDATIAENDGGSSDPVISEDGAFIFFESTSTKLIQNDSNTSSSDIFSYTRGNGEIELVSKNVDGVQADEESRRVSTSLDGRYVGFYSYATNLVEDDTNATSDLFIVDRETDEVIRAIRTYAGGEIGGDELDDDNEFMISPDGAYVVFSSDLTNLIQTDTNSRRDIFLSSLSLNSTNSGGGRSILSSGGGGSKTKTKVNENTELPIPKDNNATCEPYLPTDIYLSRKSINNPATVMKLQKFLSLYGIQYDLPVTGYYGPRTEKAVKDLQQLYINEIIYSQGFKGPTGIVGGYTAKKINDIVCFQSLF